MIHIVIVYTIVHLIMIFMNELGIYIVILDQIAVGILLWWYGVCVLVHFLAHPVPPF